MKKIIVLLLISVSARGQYVAEAPLSVVTKEGFYEIPLPPRVTALLFPGSPNLRILDSQDAEVPYISIAERPEYSNVEWKQFRMDKEMRNNCCTIVTLFNDDRKTISNFLLEVKNANINKTAILRGSDDRKTWYALREKFSMSFGELNSKSVTEVFDFPKSDYAFYQLTINDSTTSPLNVVDAWLTSENVSVGMYVDVPSISISQSDSVKGRYTWVTIHSDTSQYIDKLEFDVEGPKFYKRRATLFQDGMIQVNRKKVKRLQEITSFDIVSTQLPVIHTYAKENDIYIRVDNESNPPLEFKGVRAYQLKRSLVAWLEPGRQYRIAIGTDTLEAPTYDLGFFRDSIPSNPSKIEVGKLKEQSLVKREEPSPEYFKDPKLIWAAIILVAIVLTGMSVRMIRDKEKENDRGS